MAPGPAPCIGLLYQLAVAFPARTAAAGFRQHRSGGAICQDESSVGIFRAFLVLNATILLSYHGFGRCLATTKETILSFKQTLQDGGWYLSKRAPLGRWTAWIRMLFDSGEMGTTKTQRHEEKNFVSLSLCGSSPSAHLRFCCFDSMEMWTEVACRAAMDSRIQVERFDCRPNRDVCCC